MRFKNNLISNLVNKIGNSAFRVENADEKGAMSTTIQELREGRECAEVIVKKKSLTSSIMSIVPVPGLDSGVDLKLMKDITKDVDKTYGLDHKQVNSLGDDAKERIMSATAIQGSQFIGKGVPSTFLEVVIRDIARRTAAK